MPEEYGDYPRTENWKGFCDFHLNDDSVVIWRSQPQRATLWRIGAHSLRKHKKKGQVRTTPEFMEEMMHTCERVARVIKRCFASVWGFHLMGADAKTIATRLRL